MCLIKLHHEFQQAQILELWAPVLSIHSMTGEDAVIQRMSVTISKAETIQANSNVKDKPFIKVNVGALPMELLEAELFGAEVGAFTGAQKKRIGRFEAADGGTLFLDEIGNLPLSGQIKLLRVLQTGEFERLGSSHTRQVNVRVISATNADLLSEIKFGSFREDLYYRLNVFPIRVPALAERSDDIPLLVWFFVREFTPT